MANKTQPTKASVSKYIAAIEDDQKRKDAKLLLNMLKEITGKKPVMWGESIIGFDTYHYKSSRSSCEGDWPMIGFSPRKANISIYIMLGPNKYPTLLKKLGKHKTSKGSCLYIKRLSDIDLDVLREMMTKDYTTMKQKYLDNVKMGC